MPKIAYILLAHKDPEAIIKQASLLTSSGDYVAIHYDARSSKEEFACIYKALKGNSNIVFSLKRVRCGWGEWSLVQATLYTLKAAVSNFPRATHFYMLSGDCAPIKSSKYMQNLLGENDADFIESYDFFDSDWIKTGIKEERLIYNHWFNERTQSKRYYWALKFQQYFGLKRNLPSDIQFHIGSQWWCLRLQTVEKMLDYIQSRPDIVRFFKTTWIPDETFFQTIIRLLVPDSEIESRTLTFLMFTDYGFPVVFCNDHYDMLLAQDYLFARKISPEADVLHTELSEVYKDDEKEFRITGGGNNLFKFITTSGREGRRFGGRFWENESTLGRHRDLLIIVCKKWHVAKRLLKEVRKLTDVKVLEYVFNEVDAGLPDLGGIESSLDKRTRHRRSLIRMVYDYYDTDRLIMCMDPGNFEILEDFTSDRANVRVLEVQCEFGEDYITGHLRRIGLATDWTSENVIESLMPTVRQELYHERDRIRDANFEQHWIIGEVYSDDYNVSVLSYVFEISQEDALKIVQLPHLFDD